MVGTCACNKRDNFLLVQINLNNIPVCGHIFIFKFLLHAGPTCMSVHEHVCTVDLQCIPYELICPFFRLASRNSFLIFSFSICFFSNLVEVEDDAGDDEEGNVGDLHVRRLLGDPAKTYLFFLIFAFKFRADGDRADGDRADGDRRGEALRGDVRFGEDVRLPFVSHASNVK